MELGFIISYTICALITIETIVHERMYIQSSYKTPCSLILLVVGITYRSEPNDFTVMAVAVLNIIGCIYMMVLECKDISDSTLFQYSMLIMIYIIYRIMYPESESITFVGIVSGCIVSIVSLTVISKWKIEETHYYKIMAIVFISPLAYYGMGLQLRGVCIGSSILVLPWVWIMGVVGYGRIDIVLHYGKLWDGYDCDHGCKLSSVQRLPTLGFFGNFVMNIVTHTNSQNTMCQYEHAGYLGLCVINAPIDHLKLIEHLAEDGTLAKIGSDERKQLIITLLRLGTNLLIRNDEYDIARATSLAMSILMFEKVPSISKMTTKDIVSMTKGGAELDVRGITKFYSKRIGCSCLARKYKSHQKGSKLAMCFECKHLKKSTSLFWCTGCMTRLFCCKDCQRKDWEGGHKDCCKDIASLLTRSLIVGSSECSD